MARKKVDIRSVSYGIYTPFEHSGRQLPEIVEFTKQVPARLGIEFGYILDIKKARGQKLQFKIDHPPFPDSSGQVAPPFTGEVYIRSSDYRFFLGDTFWEPLSDKVGRWVLTAELDGKVVARESFLVVEDTAG